MGSRANGVIAMWFVIGCGMCLSSTGVASVAPGFVLRWRTTNPKYGMEAFSATGGGCGPDGTVYIVDASHRSVVHYSETGVVLGVIGGTSEAEGALDYPWDVAVDGRGHVFVTDYGKSCVVHFSADGQYIATLGAQGSAPGQLSSPTGITTNGDNEVVVVDSGNSRVQVFDGVTGRTLRMWGGAGSGPGQLMMPTGVAQSSAGEVFVSDVGDGRIQVFSASGTYLRGWTTLDTGASRLGGIAITENANVLVCDHGLGRCLMYGSAGVLEAQWGRYGNGNGYFNHPDDVAVDVHGNIYIIDSDNFSVQKFSPQLPPDPEPEAYTAKLVVHVAAANSGGECSGAADMECAGLRTSGRTGAGERYYVYLMVKRGSVPSLAGVQLGISYSLGGGGAGTGISVLSWTLCGDRDLSMTGEAREWPGPGSGNQVYWNLSTNCQYAGATVAGYFYIEAPSSDTLRVGPWPTDGRALVADCLATEYAVAREDWGYAVFSDDGLADGCNPCVRNCERSTSIEKMTWSRIKGLYAH